MTTASTSAAIMHPPTTGSTFHVVLTDFKTSLTQAEKEDFKMTDLATLKQTIVKLQADQEKRRSLMYMRRLEPFLQAMETYGKVVEVFLNTSDMLAFVWAIGHSREHDRLEAQRRLLVGHVSRADRWLPQGPMKFILLTASTYSDVLNNVLDAYQTIGDEIPLLIDFELLPSNQHMEKVLGLIYKDILEFHKMAMRCFRKSHWKSLFTATWTGLGKKIAHLVDNMKEHRRLIEGRATLMQLQEAIALRERLDDKIDHDTKEEHDQHCSEAKIWLSAYDSRVDQGRHRDARVCPDSGQWLLKDPIFENWRSFDFCSTPLLWLTGILGAGKTVLASAVIDELLQDSKTKNMTLVYFYCKFSDQRRNSFLSIARSLISQLISGCPDAIPKLSYERRVNSPTATLDSPNQAGELLNLMIRTAVSKKTVYMVLDGLDECSKECLKKTAEWVQEFSNSLATNEKILFRCLFVSRDEAVARSSFKQISQLKITTDDISQDIGAFSKHWSREIERKFGRLTDPTHNIPRIITAKAQGMFLYAKLALEHLLDLPTEEDLISELKSEHFPSELNEVYARIMDRMNASKPEATQEKVKTVLGWIVCAPRPLRWREIQCALTIDLDEESTNDSRRLVDDPKALFSAFVEVQSNNMVELVHETARGYLTSSGYVVPRDAHRKMTEMAMSYMCMQKMDANLSQSRVQIDLFGGFFGLLDYSSACWLHHLQGAFPKSSDSFDEKVLEELTLIIEDFVDVHCSKSSKMKKLPVSTSTKKMLSALSSCESIDRILQAVTWCKRQLSINCQAPSDDEALDVWKKVKGLREILETVSTSPLAPEKHMALRHYYGEKRFKCPRISCYYYHEGFKTKGDRDRHDEKHEKPFLCVVNDCLHARFGFANKAELMRHAFEKHGLDFQVDWEYPAMEESSDDLDTNRSQKSSGKFACTQCDKKFTRNHPLQRHLRKHAGNIEKQHTCSTCGMAFERGYDRDRHERHHGDGEKFLCYGKLDDGTEWGCRAQFKRRDKREDHFRSKKGKQCILPFVKQKLQQDALSGSQESLTNSLAYDGDVMLPRFKEFLKLCGLENQDNEHAERR